MPRPQNRGMSNPNAKLNRWKVQAIRKVWERTRGLNGRYKPTMQQLADKHGVSRATISGIVNRKNWKLLT